MHVDLNMMSATLGFFLETKDDSCRKVQEASEGVEYDKKNDDDREI